MINLDTHRNTSLKDIDLRVDKPAKYCIRGVGNLDDSWSERLAGMAITSYSQEEKRTITTLSGSIADQAAFFGVLKALFDILLPLLSVECLEIN